eukprot:gene1516-12642_t
MTSHNPSSYENQKTSIQKYQELFDLNDTDVTQSQLLFSRLQESSALMSVFDTTNDREKLLSISAIFMASHFVDNKLIVEGLPLKDVFSKTDISIVDFFEILNACCSACDFENQEFYFHFKKVQKQFVVAASLYEHNFKYFSNFFITENDDLKKFCWLLFLSLQGTFTDLLLDFYTSQKIFAHLILHLWKILPEGVKSTMETTVSILSTLFLSEEEIINVKSVFDESIDFTFKNILNLKNHDVIQMDKISTYNDALTESFETKFPIDFRMIQNTDKVGSIEKLISAPIYQLNPQKILENSPIKNEKPKSVFDATLRSINLLHAQLEDSTEVPNEKLNKFLNIKDDIKNRVMNRVSSFVDKINFEYCLDNEECTLKKNFAKKLYYDTLLKMLLGEEHRLGQTDFSTLLNNENFNRSLIVCSIETILFAYNCKDTVVFQDLLNTFDLQAFDFCKIIESFVLHNAWMSSSFKRHFRTIEESLFDSLSWKDGSVLYQRVEATKLEQEVPTQKPMDTPLAKKKASFMVFDSPGPSNQIIKKKSHSLDFFFRKIYKIVYKRSTDLCSFFQSFPDPTEQVCAIVHHILTNNIEFMKNRTLDQIILSSVYALFKVNKIEIRFRDIIYNYKIVCENNRQLSPIEVGRSLWSIPLNEEENGDLVKFYNSAFIPKLKNFILNIPQNQSKSYLPKQQVAPNLFVSPLRRTSGNTPVKSSTVSFPQMTPKTKALFSFGEGFSNKEYSTHGFSSPGPKKTPNTTPLVPPSTITPSSGKKSSKRALSFDNEEQDDSVKNKLKKLKQ